MEHEPKTQHHEQQARTTETEEWQRHTSERKHTCHSADVHNDVCHDKAKYSRDNQPHSWVTQTVDHQEQPTQQHKEQSQDNHQPDEAKRFA